MTHKNNHICPLSLTAILLAMTLPLTGCGAGQSNNTDQFGTAPQTVTLTGTVVAGTGSAASGETVVLDGNSALSATTNGQGQFTLSVPTTDITGHDTLAVQNSAGVVLQTQAITMTSGITINLPVVPNQPTNLTPTG